jgi:CheY-like chemotaxis protein
MANILLAEDCDADCLLVEIAIGDAQIPASLHRVKNGLHAIRSIEAVKNGERLPFDLLIVDLHLPMHDGPEIMRYWNEVLREKPIIVMSGSDPRDFHIVPQATWRFFRKPLVLEEYLQLGELIKEVLSISTQMRAIGALWEATQTSH